MRLELEDNKTIVSIDDGIQTEDRSSNEQNNKEQKSKESDPVHILFIIRIVLWVIAFGATAYWIWYSFYLFELGEYDVYEYTASFRPVFTVCLIITAVALLISVRLRKISDGIKEIQKMERTKAAIEEARK